MDTHKLAINRKKDSHIVCSRSNYVLSRWPDRCWPMLKNEDLPRTGREILSGCRCVLPSPLHRWGGHNQNWATERQASGELVMTWFMTWVYHSRYSKTTFFVGCDFLVALNTSISVILRSWHVHMFEGQGFRCSKNHRLLTIPLYHYTRILLVMISFYPILPSLSG